VSQCQSAAPQVRVLESWVVTYLDVLVCHSDVVSVGSQVLRGGHDGELNGALVAKGLVRPSSDGSDLLDSGDTVVCNQDLQTARQYASKPQLEPLEVSEGSWRPLEVPGGVCHLHW
jgi:hypothetical protein